MSRIDELAKVLQQSTTVPIYTDTKYKIISKIPSASRILLSKLDSSSISNNPYLQTFEYKFNIEIESTTEDVLETIIDELLEGIKTYKTATQINLEVSTATSSTIPYKNVTAVGSEYYGYLFKTDMKVNTTIPTLPTHDPSTDVVKIFEYGNWLMCSIVNTVQNTFTNNELYYSTDNGASWTAMPKVGWYQTKNYQLFGGAFVDDLGKLWGCYKSVDTYPATNIFRYVDANSAWGNDAGNIIGAYSVGYISQYPVADGNYVWIKDNLNNGIKRLNIVNLSATGVSIMHPESRLYPMFVDDTYVYFTKEKASYTNTAIGRLNRSTNGTDTIINTTDWVLIAEKCAINTTTFKVYVSSDWVTWVEVDTFTDWNMQFGYYDSTSETWYLLHGNEYITMIKLRSKTEPINIELNNDFYIENKKAYGTISAEWMI